VLLLQSCTKVGGQLLSAIAFTRCFIAFTTNGHR